MSRTIKLILALGLMVGTGLLSAPQVSYADYSYGGATSSDDIIYFGCIAVGDHYELRIVRKTGDLIPIISPAVMDTGRLTIDGREGNDYIEAVSGKTKEGVTFADIRHLEYSEVYLYGGDGNDTIIGTPFDDRIEGGIGDDHLKGMGGNDLIYGNTGSDVILGGTGHDRLEGGTGDDDVQGEVGNDIVLGHAGEDVLVGGVDNDLLIGHGGDDELYGLEGDDVLFGRGGNDVLGGWTGNDVIIGDEGNDHLYGEWGNDILMGGIGNDYIDGGPDSDIFRCRRATYPITLYDGNETASDCDDVEDLVNVEATQIRDPYLHWAYMVFNRNGVTDWHFTTSNPGLLLGERAAGASILISEGGDMPLSGDFDRDRRYDDVAVFRSETRKWYYDYDHDGDTDPRSGASIGPWGATGDRPVAGDFDHDRRNDDVAVFRPSTRMWFYDRDHDGDTDPRPGFAIGPWGAAGDIPIAGDFDWDGRNDDVGVFRPSTGMWYYDYNHNGSTDARSGPWGRAGDIPITGDFDRDGRHDDVGVFRPSNGRWYYDHNHNGTTDPQAGSYIGPWGQTGDIPVAGDFDRDGRDDDVAFFRLSNAKWYYDYDHDGDTDPDPSASVGPWGTAGEPLRTVHKQYGQSCGPSSLAMVMEYLGLSDYSLRWQFLRDLDNEDDAHVGPLNLATYVDVGYKLSTEHIMYEGFRERTSRSPDWHYEPVDYPHFVDGEDHLNTVDATPNENNADDKRHLGSFYEIQYDIGHVDWDPGTGTASGAVQSWTRHSPGVGSRGLVYVANEFYRKQPDARAAATEIISEDRLFKDLNHLEATIKGFIDHGIPVVVGLEDGGHFNTLVGYWDTGQDFYIYTADPLDGWGRPWQDKPMRWRRITLSRDSLSDRAAVFVEMMLFGHSDGCSGDDDWARQIDIKYRRDTLCGHLP